MPILIAVEESGSVSFDALYIAHRTRIYQRCYQLLSHVEDAEDACQETFMRAWRNWETCQREKNLYGWLFVIATNIAYDKLRRRRLIAFQSIEEWDAPSSHDVESEVELRVLIGQAMADQTKQHQRILLGRNAYTYQEMADHLGLSLANFTDHLYRARKAFKRRYQEQEAA